MSVPNLSEIKESAADRVINEHVCAVGFCILHSEGLDRTEPKLQETTFIGT